MLLALVLCYGVTVPAMGRREGEKERRRERERWEEEGEEEAAAGRRRRSEEWLLSPDSKPLIRTDAGEMRIARSLRRTIIEKPLHIGFITMEPNTLFIPQYLDSSSILFLRTGISLIFISI